MGRLAMQYPDETMALVIWAVCLGAVVIGALFGAVQNWMARR